MDIEKVQKIRNQLEQKFVAPLVEDYVRWILSQAADRNIKTLYFLARDGYPLLQIAQMICEVNHLPIECRYLYCSRAALRMPSYHLIGEEAYELLLIGGYQVTLGTFLDRADLSPGERTLVKDDCGLGCISEDKILNQVELDVCRKLLQNSPVYRGLVLQKSKDAYAPAMAYFRQEGLLDADTVAIVDSGWSGSMQRSLRQLLESAGFHGQLVGFYYGMYKIPADPKDGTYLTYFFNAVNHKRNRIILNNNLFECLLSAPHGMTISYKIAENGRAEPVLLPSGYDTAETEAFVRRLVHYIQKEPSRTVDIEKMRQHSAGLVYRYMVLPTAEEAQILGSYHFCDDITEGFYHRLAEPEQLSRLKNHLIINKVFRKLNRKAETHTDIYWPYGTIAFLPERQRWWYRWNIYTWEWLKVFLKK